MDVSISTIAQLVSGGGVLAFAALVYWQLIGFKSELVKHRDEETETRKELARIGRALALLLDRSGRPITGPIRLVEDSDEMDPLPKG